MIIALLITTLLLVLSITALYYSIKRNLELLEIVENSNLQIDESIEQLELIYKRLEKKSKLELFSDEPAIRELVEDLKQAKKVVTSISNALIGEKSDIDVDETQKNKNQKESS